MRHDASRGLAEVLEDIAHVEGARECWQQVVKSAQVFDIVHEGLGADHHHEWISFVKSYPTHTSALVLDAPHRVGFPLEAGAFLESKT